MKEHHLPSHCPYKEGESPKSDKVIHQCKFCILLFIFIACTSAPSDDNSLPLSLHLQPQSIEANPLGGYKENVVTGRTLQPLTNAFGKEVISGKSIPAVGRLIHPDSVEKPKKVNLSNSPKKITARTNVHEIPQPLKKFPIDKNWTNEHFIGKGELDKVFINSTGDTIPTGKSIQVKGKIISAQFPTWTSAHLPRMKDNALYDIQFLDMENGMSSSFVHSVYIDNTGILWFGTFAGGVSRYDGKSFLHFTEAEGLSNNTVNFILQDKKDNLWFGTNGGGVCKYNGESFVHFTTKEGLLNNNVLTILEDRKGNLWFGTNGGGVSKFEPTKNGHEGVLVHYTTKEGLSHNTITSILEDRSGQLWFGSEGGGVNRFLPSNDGKSGYFAHFTTANGLSNNKVKSMLEDKFGNLWFGTDGGGVSMYELSGENSHGQLVHFTTLEGLSHNSVNSIFEDHTGNIWIATFGGGVCKYELSTESQTGSFVHFTTIEGLSNNFVNSITEDEVGNLWFGTHGGGVNRYNLHSFVHLTKTEGIPDNHVISLLEDSSGDLWFGTLGGGVSKYELSKEGKAGSFLHYTTSEGLANNNIWAILEDINGNIWFSTLGDGVSKLERPKNGKAESLVHITTAEGLSNNFVRSILEDRYGNLWFATFGGGVTKYEPNTNNATGTFIHFTEKEGFANNFVRSILEDKAGNLWFGTDGGVTKYEPPKEEGSIGSFFHFTTAEGLSDNSIWAIEEDEAGNLWFGTGGMGATRYEPSTENKGGSFTHLTTAEGLSYKYVNTILEDQSGILWFGTGGGGLSRYEKPEVGQNGFFIQFTTAKGLSNNIVRTMLEDKSGNLWLGTQGGGVSRYEKNMYNPTLNSPVVHLRQLFINEELPDYRNPNSSLAQDIEFTGVHRFENFPLNLRLPYEKNHLRFYFSAIDWAAPHKIRYSYRMLGLKNNWSTPTADVSADYRNMPNGTYTFQIRAIGENGEWSKPFEYKFIISPPWWMTWWAYFIYALIVIMVFGIFSKWREKNLREKNESLEYKVKERTLQLELKSQDLSESLKNLKLTQAQLIQAEKMASLGELTAGIAHEIQNPLNFVNNFSEVSEELILEIEEEIAKSQEVRDEMIVSEILKDVKDNLIKINHHGRRADAIVKQMLEHSKSGSGQKELTNVNALVKEYLNLAFQGYKAKNEDPEIELVMDFDSSIPEIELIRSDIGKVLLNIVNNAFYACTEIKKNLTGPKSLITVSTKNFGNKIEISISDNGPGIPDTIKGKIFQPFFTTKPTGQGTGLGLSLSYDIIKAHGGEFRFESEKNVRTIFYIYLKI